MLLVWSVENCNLATQQRVSDMLRLSLGLVTVVSILAATTPARSDDWGGAYVGAHVGGAWSDIDYTWGLPDFTGPFAAPFPQSAPVSISDNGVVGGLHIGFQKQFGQMVIGIEGTASYTSAGGQADEGNDVNTTGYQDVDIKGIYTLAGRLGLAVSPRLMAYAKAGLALVRTDISDQSDNINIVSPDPVPRYIDARSKSNDIGWTIGVGADFKMTSNVLLGISYDYIRVNIDDRSADLSNGFAPGRRTFTDIDLDVHAVTARLTYLFQAPQRVPYK